MRVKTFYRALRFISAIVLFFFLWTFGPVWQAVAFAAESRKAPGVKTAGSKISVPLPATAAEKFEKALDDIRQKLRWAEDKSREGVEPTPEIEVIKAKKAEIESIDSELKSEFGATEKKLKDAKLPKEILNRHYNFVKHYQDNLQELVANLEQLERAGTKVEVMAAVTKARRHLESVKAPSHHQKLDPNNLPFRARKAGKTREPRTKEQFEKDFPPQRTQWSPRTAYLNEKQSGRKDAHPALAHALINAGHRQEAQKFDRKYTRTKHEPIQLAYNGSLSDLPLSLDSEQRSESPNLPVIALESLLLALADLPTSDDLAETTEIQFTPEILGKAQELGSAPNIFAWVRNNIKYEPYYGSLKGAQQTLLEGAGNDFDQASLLIALLRGINIPAKYVYGTVEIPIERVTSWLGVTDPIVAGTILSTNGIPTTLIKTSSGVYKTVRLEHCWVSAFVNMLPSFGVKNYPANMWVSIDPSFKEHNVAASSNLSNMIRFDESLYLSNRNNMPPSMSYFLTAGDNYLVNNQGDYIDVFYAKNIIKEKFGIFLGTLPYQIVSVGQTMTEVQDSMRHTISFSLYDPSTGTTSSIRRAVCKLTGKKITASYETYSQQDEAVLNNFGGLLKTPAYLLRVETQVKIDGTVLLEGPKINLGQSVKLKLTFISPDMNPEAIETDMADGIYYVVGLAALNTPSEQVSTRLENLTKLTGTFNDSINLRDDQVGEVLYNIAIEYFNQVINASKILEALMHVQNTLAVSSGFVSVRTTYANVFGIPMSAPSISGVNLDIQRYIQSPFAIDGDQEQRKTFAKIQGLNTSFFEHSILETFLRIEAISTVKVLQVANEAGIPIYTITSTNISDILPILTVTPEVKTDIQNAVHAEKEVTIPRDNIRLNDWIGTGYIIRDPNTGAGAYMISTGLAGGNTASPPRGALALLAGDIAAFAVGLQMSGKLEKIGEALSEVPNAVMDYIGDMLIGRGYIKKVENTFKKQQFIALANNQKNWIFNYVGHGARTSDPNDPAVLAVGADNEDEDVVPSDVHVDVHIAFLNSCYSAENPGFKGAFGIDQQHPGMADGRKEVILGWKGMSYLGSNLLFAHRWWSNMAFKKTTAQEAANNADFLGIFTNYNSSFGPKIILEGDKNTILY